MEWLLEGSLQTQGRVVDHEANAEPHTTILEVSYSRRLHTMSCVVIKYEEADE